MVHRLYRQQSRQRAFSSKGWLDVSVLPVSTVAAHAVRASSIFAADTPLVVSIYAWERDGTTGELVAAMSEVLSNRRADQFASCRQKVICLRTLLPRSLLMPNSSIGAVLASPIAQPRSVIGGKVIPALVEVGIASSVSSPTLASRLADLSAARA